MKGLRIVSLMMIFVLLISTSVNAFEKKGVELSEKDIELNEKGFEVIAEPIKLSDDLIELLPQEAKKIMQKDKEEKNNDIVVSVATIHVFEEVDGKPNKKLKEINYDLSKEKDIKKYNSDVKLFKENKEKGIENFGVKTSKGEFSILKEDNHYGIMTTGLTVQKFSGSYTYDYHLHGWWDWTSSGYTSSYDRLGLLWQREFSSPENTHNAYANTKYNNVQTKLTRLPYRTLEMENRGVLWKHHTSAVTVGAAAAHVYHRSNFKGMTWGVAFDYASVGGPTSDSSWVAAVTNMYFNYKGIPSPPVQHYRTYVSVTLP